MRCADGEAGRIIVAGLFFAFAVQANPQTLGFAAQQLFATGAGPVTITAADLNCDGKADLIVVLEGDTVSVLLNTTVSGAAVASFTSTQTFVTGAGHNTVTTADINGDGKRDIVLENGSDNTVSVLLNTTSCGASTPSFALQQTFATGTYPHAVVAADINGDGKLDMIVPNGGDNTISVLLNATPPGASVLSFVAQQTFSIGMQPFSVASTDVNGDGKADIVVANVDDNTISVLLNFTAPGALLASFGVGHNFAVGDFPGPITAADVNKDGKPDLIVANSMDNTLSVLLNTTAPGVTIPSFTPQQIFLTGLFPISIATGDFNGDGRSDLVVANAGANFVGVLLNTTSLGAALPNLADQQIFATGSNPFSAIAADINADGKPDVVAANYADNTISVLLNTTVPWDRLFTNGFE